MSAKNDFAKAVAGDKPMGPVGETLWAWLESDERKRILAEIDKERSSTGPSLLHP
jgi:hypothetical protein